MEPSSPIPSPVDFPSPDFSFSGGHSPGPHSPGPARSPDFGPDRDWRDRRFSIPKQPDTRPRALTPPGFSDDDGDDDGDESLQRPAAAFQHSVWFKLPANLRRDILRLAFGDRRVHIHLAFDPFVRNLDDPHALELSGPEANLWSWNGCVCVRKYDPELGPMTRPGLNPGPWIDYCCDPVNVPQPPPENIGIMGWLQSCRQNYAEGIDVLYSTNTIIVSGAVTIIELPSLVARHHLTKITSLEIRVPITKDDALEDVMNLILPNSLFPRFPNLKRLYVSMEWSAVNTRDPDLDDLVELFDSLARKIKECAFAVPMEWFSRISWGRIRDEITGRQNTYSQFWRELDKGVYGFPRLHIIRLPYVDSYPRPPHHLENPGPGYWILEASEMPLNANPDFLTEH